MTSSPNFSLALVGARTSLAEAATDLAIAAAIAPSTAAQNDVRVIAAAAEAELRVVAVLLDRYRA